MGISSLVNTLLLALIALWGCFALSQNAPPEASVPSFKKVVLVIFENEEFKKPMSQPFFSKLAREGALLTNYHAVAHPSQPNYIALTSGDVNGVHDDKTHNLGVHHIGDLLESTALSWKSYAEDLPSPCFMGARKGFYVRKHVPFMSYVDVTSDKTGRCQNIVNATQFKKDVANNSLPHFSFYTPNLINDAHDSNISISDHWFNSAFNGLLQKLLDQDVLLVVTFDENGCGLLSNQNPDCHPDTNHVYTIFYGKQVKAGAVTAAYYNHYNLLKTLEMGFRMGNLGRKDALALPITGIWK